MLLAYPDTVARRRGDTLMLSNGQSARLDGNSATAQEFLTAIEIDDRSDRTMPLVRITSAVEPDWLLEFFPERIETREELEWNREAERVEQVNSLWYDRLVIDRTRSAATDPAAASELLAAKAEDAGWEKFCEREEVERFLRRLHFAVEHGGNPGGVENLIESTLRQLTIGTSSFAELREISRGGGFLRTMRKQVDMNLVDGIAPAFIQLPSGRSARIEYYDGQPPAVSSRLQDFFGMKETPRVAGGAVPLVVKLLAPNQRPVQVTTDLVSFWKNLYPQLRRELSRRYPKHSWPEKPA